VIEEITIRDLGVIGQATLPLGPGFTAVTGETGAGKTMVVTALGLLLGARADSGAVRQGSERAVVEGRWIIAADGPVPERVRDAGGDVDPFGDGTRGELIVTRQLSSEGRSRASVGGRGAPAALLTEIGEQLVVVHGQSDQMRLRSSTAQRQALDRFAGSALAPVLGEYKEVFRRWQSARAELDRLVTEQDARTREAEELRAAIDAIEAVAPQPGEDEELRERIDRLTNLEDLRAAASAAHELMSSEDASGEMADAASVLDTAHRRLDRVAAHDPGLAEIIESLDSARILVAEIAVQLSGYLAGLDADGARELETLQDRRAELAALTRAHGPTVEDALAFLDTGSARLLELDGDTDRIDLLRVEVERDEHLVGELAARVTAVREEAGARLAAAVTTELGALAMADASLDVRVSQREEPALSGADRVEILLRPHAGAEARPLGRGASGGELSRVMLAIEVVVAGDDPVPTFVFDEVDAGVGGAAAIEIGRRLARLAERAQVIVVTHLAQVAAFSTNHLRVVKGGDGQVTASSVTQLEGDARIQEMARLLSGLPDSESGLAHARELVETAASLR
jgi:DNA repair protein RecN (Recombination protein N)